METTDKSQESNEDLTVEKFDETFSLNKSGVKGENGDKVRDEDLKLMEETLRRVSANKITDLNSFIVVNNSNDGKIEPHSIDIYLDKVKLKGVTDFELGIGVGNIPVVGLKICGNVTITSRETFEEMWKDEVDEDRT